MVTEETPAVQETERNRSIGPAQKYAAEQIARFRKAQRLTYVELAQRLEQIGRPLRVLALQRIENGNRRIDVDDLLALSVALGVYPHQLHAALAEGACP
jgi:transcriptional regulator with XRE-family HTH domain